MAWDKGDVIVLEPFQEEAVQWLAHHRRGLVSIAAGGGKTVVAAAALDRVIKSRKRLGQVRIGWMCNTKEQGEQAAVAIKHFPSLMSHNIIIACAALGRGWSDRDVLVTDEVHHGTANGWAEQIKSCKGAVWGFTATPVTGNDERDIRLLDMFGGQMFKVDRAQLVGGRLVEAKVVMVDATDECGPAIDQQIEQKFRNSVRWKLKQFAAERPAFKRALWDKQMDRRSLLAALNRNDPESAWAADEIGKSYMIVAWQACSKVGIVQNKARNDMVVKLATEAADKHVLILCNQIEHAKALAIRIFKAAVCYAGMGDKRRRECVESFRSGSLGCVVATTVFDEGADFQIADTLILVSGGRSTVKAEQRTGRVLRSFKGKDHGLIYDFTDKAHPLTARHAEKRLALYHSLDYEVTYA